MAQRDAHVIDSLATITVPTLVVVGSRDTNFLSAADYMAAKIPGALQGRARGAGHAANVDAADAFNAATRDFLGDVIRATDTGGSMIKLVFTIRRRDGYDARGVPALLARGARRAREAPRRWPLRVRRYVQTHARNTDLDERARRITRKRAASIRRGRRAVVGQHRGPAAQAGHERGGPGRPACACSRTSAASSTWPTRRSG